MAIVNLTKAEQFDALLQKPLLLVDFWAIWCAPCRAMLPSIERIALEHPDLTVLKINADHFSEVLKRYQVRGLPALLLFSHGQEQQRSHDTLTYRQLKQWLAGYITDEVNSWLAKAEHLHGAAKLEALRQAVAAGSARLMAQEALLSALFQARHEEAAGQELKQRIEALPHELRRSPVLSRILSVLQFAQDFADQPKVLQGAYELAVAERYDDALEVLLALPREQFWLAKPLMVQILDLMPDRKLAHQYRRQMAALS